MKKTKVLDSRWTIVRNGVWPCCRLQMDDLASLKCTAMKTTAAEPLVRWVLGASMPPRRKIAARDVSAYFPAIQRVQLEMLPSKTPSLDGIQTMSTMSTGLSQHQILRPVGLDSCSFRYLPLFPTSPLCIGRYPGTLGSLGRDAALRAKLVLSQHVAMNESAARRCHEAVSSQIGKRARARITVLEHCAAERILVA